MRRIGPLLVLVALTTCDANDAECEASDEPASLAIDNRSGVRVETLTATPCDGGEEQPLALPEDGIDFPAQATVELPGPGCWLLSWSGEGCRSDPPHQTSSEVCGGTTYEWTISVEDQECEGGW